MSTISKQIMDQLLKRGEKLVFAESCTAGSVAAEFAKTPGASACLCGSFVTYRPKMKRRVLGVKRKTIKRYTTESPQVVEQMVRGALDLSGADWGVAVVGHFGPKAPADKDGVIWIAIARRTKKGKIVSVKSDTLTVKGRVARCKATTAILLQRLNETIEVAGRSPADEGEGSCQQVVGTTGG